MTKKLRKTHHPKTKSSLVKSITNHKSRLHQSISLSFTKRSGSKSLPLSHNCSTLTGSLIILISSLLAISTVWYYSRYDWYGIVGMTPDEVAKTLVDIRESRGRKPRLNMGDYQGKANIRKNYSKYDSLLQEISVNEQVDCTLLKAVMLAESHANPNATSKSGALGLMQVIPSTARSMGVYGNLYNPRNSIQAGARYIKHLTQTGCNERSSNAVCNIADDYKYLIAAYNGGSGANDHGLGRCSHLAAWECLDYDAYHQTRVYVGRVKANYDLLMDHAWGCN